MVDPPGDGSAGDECAGDESAGGESAGHHLQCLTPINTVIQANITWFLEHVTTFLA